MAVVINELEVVPAPAAPAAKKEGDNGAQAGGGPRPKVMREIEKHLRREHERSLRLWAH